MTNDEARRVLEEMGARLKPCSLFLYGPRVAIFEIGWDEVQLEGPFTADQLEAIAMWMRDPKGFMPAASQPEP